MTELDGLLSRVKPGEVAAAIALIQQARRVFVAGSGRSGLSLQMVAMRLMHLGLDAHVAGEASCPAIREGDLLICASASGSTAGVLRAAKVAQTVGAMVLAITAQEKSALTELTQHVLLLPAATKQQFADRASVQYAGSLFEQAVLLVCDGIFHTLWQAGGTSAEELMQRHTNLE